MRRLYQSVRYKICIHEMRVPSALEFQWMAHISMHLEAAWARSARMRKTFIVSHAQRLHASPREGQSSDKVVVQCYEQEGRTSACDNLSNGSKWCSLRLVVVASLEG